MYKFWCWDGPSGKTPILLALFIMWTHKEKRSQYGAETLSLLIRVVAVIFILHCAQLPLAYLPRSSNLMDVVHFRHGCGQAMQQPRWTQKIASVLKCLPVTLPCHLRR